MIEPLAEFSTPAEIVLKFASPYRPNHSFT